MGLLGILAGGCSQSQHGGPRPVYDAQTRQLIRLDWDSDRDGRVDQRTYFVGPAAVRTEIDTDGDGRVDRWEYVDAQAAVTHIGTSSAADAVEDTWTWPADSDGVVRIDRARAGDGVIDRREFVKDATLVRAEEDANRDGVMDKWETWEGGVLLSAAFDSTFASGRPDRRAVYSAGRFAYLETDSDGNGHFERLAINQPGSGDNTRDRH